MQRSRIEHTAPGPWHQSRMRVRGLAVATQCTSHIDQSISMKLSRFSRYKEIVSSEISPRLLVGISCDTHCMAGRARASDQGTIDVASRFVWFTFCKGFEKKSRFHLNAGESVLGQRGRRTVGVRRCARACASEGRNDLVQG